MVSVDWEAIKKLLAKRKGEKELIEEEDKESHHNEDIASIQLRNEQQSLELSDRSHEALREAILTLSYDLKSLRRILNKFSGEPVQAVELDRIRMNLEEIIPVLNNVRNSVHSVRGFLRRQFR